jgi:hypothetical protein
MIELLNMMEVKTKNKNMEKSIIGIRLEVGVPSKKLDDKMNQMNGKNDIMEKGIMAEYANRRGLGKTAILL